MHKLQGPGDPTCSALAVQPAAPWNHNAAHWRYNLQAPVAAQKRHVFKIRNSLLQFSHPKRETHGPSHRHRPQRP
jgi:hypothetical protein